MHKIDAGKVSSFASQRQTVLASLVACTLPFALLAAPSAAAAPPKIKGGQMSPPADFLSASVRVDRFPLFFTLNRLVERIKEKKNIPVWEKDGSDWILRTSRYDAFSKHTDRIAFEFALFSAASANAGAEVIITRAMVNGTEYTGRPLVAFASAGFKDLMGSNFRKPAISKADCLARVAKDKADTAGFVADQKRQGKYVPDWLNNGDENRFDRYGNIWDKCEADDDVQ